MGGQLQESPPAAPASAARLTSLWAELNNRDTDQAQDHRRYSSSSSGSGDEELVPPPRDSDDETETIKMPELPLLLDSTVAAEKEPGDTEEGPTDEQEPAAERDEANGDPPPEATSENQAPPPDNGTGLNQWSR